MLVPTFVSCFHKIEWFFSHGNACMVSTIRGCAFTYAFGHTPPQNYDHITIGFHLAKNFSNPQHTLESRNNNNNPNYTYKYQKTHILNLFGREALLFHVSISSFLYQMYKQRLILCFFFFSFFVCVCFSLFRVGFIVSMCALLLCIWGPVYVLTVFYIFNGE